MVHTLVRIPMSVTQARAWQADGRPVGSRSTGYAITPELLAAFDLSDLDEAEEVSREIAGIAGALVHGERCVVVAESWPVWPRPQRCHRPGNCRKCKTSSPGPIFCGTGQPSGSRDNPSSSRKGASGQSGRPLSSCSSEYGARNPLWRYR